MICYDLLLKGHLKYDSKMRGGCLKAAKNWMKKQGEIKSLFEVMLSNHFPGQISSQPNRGLVTPNHGDRENPSKMPENNQVFRIFSHFPRFSTTQLEPQNDRKTQVFF